MSSGEGGVVLTPLCQGFLKKRKDKMRLRWVTYWFKLHNTTLFFYTKKNGSTSDLRGQYYLFEVESVHELARTENKRYLFELTMKNGKRKVLAADTADLRQEWICQLLKAMKHPGSNITGLGSDWKVQSDLKRRTRSNPCNSSSSSSCNSESESSTRRHRSTTHNYCWTASMESQHVTRYTTLPTSTSLADIERCQRSENKLEQTTEETELDSDYDVLPPRKSLNYEEAIYDTPPSNRRVSARDHDMTDSIYDVPKSIFRRHDGEERPASGALLIDMMASLGKDSADWVRAAAPGATCKP